ncbi:hypothetical protein J5N97_029890 [Dioscorea zingiberensis]|uniref:Uncharacterized protein n=1 Tax=Dioscorea zingiberensis TaxID=325984 RepID=A0A9D5BW71_9LILI|nr:hypothetical protein J5N97_029890 [Dioscorea zingiberensis]
MPRVKSLDIPVAEPVPRFEEKPEDDVLVLDVPEGRTRDPAVEIEQMCAQYTEKINSVVLPRLDDAEAGASLSSMKVSATRETSRMEESHRTNPTKAARAVGTLRTDKLDVENKELKATLAQMSDDLKNVTEERNQAAEEVAKTRGTLDSSTSQCTKLVVRKVKLKSKINSLSKEIDGLKDAQGEAKKTRKSIEDRCTLAEKDCLTAKEDVERLSSELTTTKKLIASLEQDKSDPLKDVEGKN